MTESKKAEITKEVVLKTNKLNDDEIALIQEMKKNKSLFFQDLNFQSQELQDLTNSKEFIGMIKSQYEKIQDKNVENFTKEAFIIQLYTKIFGENPNDIVINGVVNTKDTKILSNFKNYDKNSILKDEEGILLELIAKDSKIKSQIEKELQEMGINRESFDPDKFKQLDQFSEDIGFLQLYQRIYIDKNLIISGNIKNIKDISKTEIIKNKVAQIDNFWGEKFNDFAEKNLLREDYDRFKDLNERTNNLEELSDEENKFCLGIQDKFIQNLPETERKEYLYQKTLNDSGNNEEIFRSCIISGVDIGDMNQATDNDIEKIYNDALKYRLLDGITNALLGVIKNNENLLGEIIKYLGKTKENFNDFSAEWLVNALSDFIQKNPDLKTQYGEYFDFFGSMKNMVLEIKNQETYQEYMQSVNKYTENSKGSYQDFSSNLKNNAEKYMIPLNEQDHQKYIEKTKEIIKTLGQGKIFNQAMIDMNKEYKSVESLSQIKFQGNENINSKYLTPELMKQFFSNNNFNKLSEQDKQKSIAKQIIKNVLYVDFWYDPASVKENAFNDDFKFENETEYQDFFYKMNYLNPGEKIKELKKYIKDENILKYLDEKAKEQNNNIKFDFKEKNIITEEQKREFKKKFFGKIDILTGKQNLQLNEAEKSLLFDCIDEVSQNFEEYAKKGLNFNNFVIDKILKKTTEKQGNKDISTLKLKKIFSPREIDEKGNIIYDGLGNLKKNSKTSEFYREFSKLTFDYGCKLYGVNEINSQTDKHIEEFKNQGINDEDIHELHELHELHNNDKNLKGKKGIDEKDKKYFYKKFIQNKLYKKLGEIKKSPNLSKEIQEKLNQIYQKIQNIDESNIEQEKNTINNEIISIAKQLNIDFKDSDLSFDNFEKKFKKYLLESDKEGSIINTKNKEIKEIKEKINETIEKAKVIQSKQTDEQKRNLYTTHYANVVIKKENPTEFNNLKAKGLVSEQDNFLSPVNTIYTSQNIIQSKEINLPQNFDYQGNKIIYTYDVNGKTIKEEIKEITFAETNKEFLRRFLERNGFDINILRGNPDEFRKNFGIDISQRLEPKHLEKIIFITSKYIIKKIEENITNCSQTEQAVLKKLHKNIILNPKIGLKQFFDFLNGDLAQKLKIYTNNVRREINVGIEFQVGENDIYNLRDFFENKRKDLAEIKIK